MTEKKNIKTVMFDLGGVYFTEGAGIAIKKCAKKYNKTEDEFREAFLGELSTQFRVGKITRDEYWNRVIGSLGLDVTGDELSLDWITCYEPIEGTVDIVDDLKKAGYELFVLSDTVQERLDYLDNKYGFLKKFDEKIYSMIMGFRKPDPRVFEFALSKTKSKPEECVFIDNKEKNLEPAKKKGINIILFKNPDQLRDDLINLGLKF